MKEKLLYAVYYFATFLMYVFYILGAWHLFVCMYTHNVYIAGTAGFFFLLAAFLSENKNEIIL